MKTEDEPGQEDFGWYLNFEVAGTAHTLVIGYRPGGEDDEGTWIEWLERKRGLVGSLLGTRRRGIDPTAPETLHKILLAHPGIRDVRWHFRHAFDKGREELGAPEPSRAS